MRTHLGLALVLLIIPGLVRAEDQAPEKLFSDATQIFLRFDGIEGHRAAFEKTALGKTLQGDTGKFLTGLYPQILDSLSTSFSGKEIAKGVSPERLQKIQTDATEARKLLDLLLQHGFLFGAEVRGLVPPIPQVTLVVPNAGAGAAPLFSMIRLIIAMNNGEVKQQTVAGRDVQFFQAGIFSLSWWLEGPHAVIVGGLPAESVIKMMQEPKGRLPDHPLFQRIKRFDQFDTGLRGFLDVASINRLTHVGGNPVGKVIDELGLDGVKSGTFYFGFEGDAVRSVMELEMPAPRKGLLNLAGSGKTFTLAEAPPVPADATRWSMMTFNAETVYDTAIQVVESIVRVTSPGDVDKVKEAYQQVDETLSIDVRKDLLAHLGDRLVLYGSPVDGPLFFGQTALIRVKDAKKVQFALDQAAKALAVHYGGSLRLKKRPYRGVDLTEVHVKQQGFVFLPSFAVCKDWLALGFYPQPVQGFILRAVGELPSWQPAPQVQASFAKLPKEFMFVSVADPRPTIQQVLTLAPAIGAAVNSFNNEINFDVGAMPNGHLATQFLFPNVLVIRDDGKTIRVDTRGSLELPLELTGLDTYTALILTSFLRLAN